VTGPLQRLFSLGVRPDTPTRVAQRITAANGSILSNGVGALVAGAVLMVTGPFELGLALLAVPLLLSVGLVLIVLGRPMAARLWVSMIQPVIMLAVAVVIGAEVVLAVPFVVVLVPFTVFTTEERLQLGASLVVALAAATVLFVPGLLPPPLVELDRHVVRLAEGIISLAVFAALCLTLLVAARARDDGIDQLDAARLAAEAGQRTQASFLANMSHEIRTPLGAILGWVQLLDDPRTSADERTRAVETLRRNSGHLMELVDQVLDLSKMEAGELLLDQVHTSVVGVVEDVASLMRVRAVARGIGFVVSWDGPVPESVCTDPLRLRQILLNLVGNAVKFTEEGRVTIRTRLADRELLFEVEDTGIGIESDSVDRLFGSFVQAEPGTARRFGGSGLGLSISRQLAVRLGADLRVESEPGEGSRFTLALPVTPEEAARLTDPGSASRTFDGDERGERNLGGLRVLLAEDSYDLAELVQLRLRHLGARVEHVGDGQAALDTLEADPTGFHAVLMDMQMPVLDGYQAVRFVRARGWKVPVIALTAHAMAGDRERCLAAGCDGYLTKPIDFDALVDRLRPHVPAGRPPTSAPGMDSNQLTETLALLREQFTAALPEKLGVIRAALERGDLEQARRGAHKLAGSSGSLGLGALGERARELELAIDGGQAGEELVALADRLEGEAGRG